MSHSAPLVSAKRPAEEKGTRWIIIGQREEGDYDWDKSAYNQCWLLHRAIQTLSKAPVVGDILERLGGSIYVVWFFRVMGADIGTNVCLYPNGADPPMREPDLVTIMDNACVDDASLVCHINSRGEFKLNKLLVGEGAVLCSHTRLLSGAAMSERSTLLEHTLVVGGDIVPEGSTLQGWPAEMLFQQQPQTDAKPESSDVCIDICDDGLKPSLQERLKMSKVWLCISRSEVLNSHSFSALLAQTARAASSLLP